MPRGRQAVKPFQISTLGWRDIIKRVFDAVSKERMSILSAGVAFYSVLAIFPAFAAILTVYALVADPQTVTEHLHRANGLLPGDVLVIFNDQLSSLASRPAQGLGMNLIVGLLFAVWSAHKGVDALVSAIGAAYHEPETRGFFKLQAITYAMTMVAVIFVVLLLVLMVVVPSITAMLPTPGWWETIAPVLRWIIFIAIVSLAIGTLYRFAPARRPAQWRWLSLGSICATVMWLIGSAAFSFYVSRFGTYNETYGTLGAIIVLLLWFFISSYAIILGAALNAEMEHQTLRDTTKGAPRPIGERGATVADTVGEIPDD